MRHSDVMLEELEEKFASIRLMYVGAYKNGLTAIFVLQILLAVFSSLLMFIVALFVNNTVKGAMIILRRIAPPAIVADQNLLNYLLDRESASKEMSMSVTGSIINNSKNAIICCTAAGMIDSVNLHVTLALGYIPNQLLGQPFSVMCDGESGKKMMTQMNMIVHGEAPRTFEDTIQCVTDRDQKVTVLANLMGMCNGDSRSVSSFVLILRDVTELVKQQEEAEEAKAKSEALLYEILPRDIVNRINQGEKDISFVVESATLMFIDIQKFSEYATNLTPQEIMGNLSQIFNGFDTILKKYPLVTKIKLIGDVYMCGAGLFSPDEEPKNHCEQMIRFAMDCLTALEEVNLKLDANLAVRIGINTGGPIIAGVLGTDKPVFDIIGDPINIAARLQSTCIAGRIQISETSYELMKDLEFQIEPRGEVWLKGKGKRPAFFIMPPANVTFLLSAQVSALGGVG
jgi:PAS domain S-box-containing protein